MSLADELRSAVKQVFADQWTTRDGIHVPAPKDVALSNAAVTFESATVLYADLSGSTGMVLSHASTFAAEVYKTFLYSTARIIRSEGGEISAYDGDRIMAVYLGDHKNQSAARTALKINYAVQMIINPAISNQYPKTTFRVRQVVGIDTSPQFVVRTGVRGDNDLVWVGRSANYAAKLTSLSDTHPSVITEDVYSRLPDNVKFGGNPPASMWEKDIWGEMGISIYRSTYWWRID